MTTAAVVVFYRYTPRINNHYQTQGELFLKYARRWFPFIDHLYIVDAGWGFSTDDLHAHTTVITDDFQSHWWYLNALMKKVTQDAVMIIDPDMLIYDSQVVRNGFDALQFVDISGVFDNSGTEVFFKENKNRADRKRFTPYLTFLRRDLLHGIDVDFTPTTKDAQFEFDSMGLLTKKILKKNPLIKELPDDRSSIYLNEDGTITTDSNMDGPQYHWSLPLAHSEPTGYYHVRNSSIGISLLDEYQVDAPAYERRKMITPFREMMRLLMWQWKYDEHTGHLSEFAPLFYPVLADYHVSIETWQKYADAFEKYHAFLKE